MWHLFQLQYRKKQPYRKEIVNLFIHQLCPTEIGKIKCRKDWKNVAKKDLMLSYCAQIKHHRSQYEFKEFTDPSNSHKTKWSEISNDNKHKYTQTWNIQKQSWHQVFTVGVSRGAPGTKCFAPFSSCRLAKLAVMMSSGRGWDESIETSSMLLRSHTQTDQPAHHLLQHTLR